MTAWLVGAAAGGAVPRPPWRALRVTVEPSAPPRPGALVRRHRRRVPGLHRHAQPPLPRARRRCRTARRTSPRCSTSAGARATRHALAVPADGTAASGAAGAGDLRRRLDRRLVHRRALPADLGERLRPAQRGGVQRPADQDYKHFLRLHVGTDGALTIWPIKIDRVPRRWRDRRGADADDVAGRAGRAAGRRADRAADHDPVGIKYSPRNEVKPLADCLRRMPPLPFVKQSLQVRIPLPCGRIPRFGSRSDV